MDALLDDTVHVEGDMPAVRERDFESELPECSRLAFRVALGVLHQREEAEDVAQETLLRAHREFRSLRKPERLRAWIVRVAWRLAIDRQRSQQRRKRREAGMADAPLCSSAEELAASEEFESALYTALEKLPERLRLVIVLAGLYGYDTREAAGLLSLPEGTVKSRLHSARKRLAEELRWTASNIKPG